MWYIEGIINKSKWGFRNMNFKYINYGLIIILLIMFNVSKNAVFFLLMIPFIIMALVKLYKK